MSYERERSSARWLGDRAGAAARVVEAGAGEHRAEAAPPLAPPSLPLPASLRPHLRVRPSHQLHLGHDCGEREKARACVSVSVCVCVLSLCVFVARVLGNGELHVAPRWSCSMARRLARGHIYVRPCVSVSVCVFCLCVCLLRAWVPGGASPPPSPAPRHISQASGGAASRRLFL